MKVDTLQYNVILEHRLPDRRVWWSVIRVDLPHDQYGMASEVVAANAAIEEATKGRRRNVRPIAVGFNGCALMPVEETSVYSVSDYGTWWTGR